MGRGQAQKPCHSRHGRRSACTAACTSGLQVCSFACCFVSRRLLGAGVALRLAGHGLPPFFQRQATPSWGEKTQPKGLAWSLQRAWGSGHRARGRWAAKLHSAGQVTVPRARCQGPAKGPGTQLRARALAAGAQRFAPWRHSAKARQGKARLQLCKGSTNCALSIFQAPGGHSPGRFALLLVFI